MNQELDGAIRSLQIVVAAMMMGIVSFGVVVLVVGPSLQPNPALAKVLLSVLGLVGLAEILVDSVLRMIVLGKLRSRLEQTKSIEEAEREALPAWQTLTLIRCAMAESFGLFGLVVALVTGAKLASIAPVIALVLLALGFPARWRLTALASSLTGHNPYAG